MSATTAEISNSPIAFEHYRSETALVRSLPGGTSEMVPSLFPIDVLSVTNDPHVVEVPYGIPDAVDEFWCAIRDETEQNYSVFWAD
jgi:hypothetical protein